MPWLGQKAGGRMPTSQTVRNGFIPFQQKQKGLKHMSKSIFAKAAAIVCGAATLCALTVSAAAAVTVDDPVADASKYTGVDSTKVNAIAGQVYVDIADLTNKDLDADKDLSNGFQVAVPTYIVNNDKGFAGIGFNVFVPTALQVKKSAKTDKEPDAKKKLCAAGMSNFVYNENTDHNMPLVGIGYVASETVLDSGEFFDFFVTIPADAKVGDEWKLETVVEDMKDEETKAIDWYNAVNGFVKIVGEAPAETSTTAVVTTTVEEAAVTTTTEVSTAAPTDGTTTSGETGTTDSTVSGTTTSGKGDKTNNNGNKDNKTDATKTGDAGVGVAAAALLLAAGTAVVATKKKKD
jgi:hypothetical protein